MIVFSFPFTFQYSMEEFFKYQFILFLFIPWQIFDPFTARKATISIKLIYFVLI